MYTSIYINIMFYFFYINKMWRKDSTNPANQNRLISVILLLIVAFAIWFGVTLKGAQTELKDISERMRSDNIIIKNMTGKNMHMNQSWNIQSGTTMSWEQG